VTGRYVLSGAARAVVESCRHSSPSGPVRSGVISTAGIIPLTPSVVPRTVRGMPRASDAWLRTTIALAIAHVFFLAVIGARPGLPAVVLWYVAPPLIALAAAGLLAIGLFRALWRGEIPTARRVGGFALLALVTASLAGVRTYPSSYDQHPSEVRFRLPLDGPIAVAWGGATLRANYHAVLADQRWAYDLLVTVDGRSFRGDGSRLEDYHVFGRPVLAPSPGVVRVVRDGEPDGPIGQWRVFRAAGNHVVVQVAEREFLFISHLQKGSIAVAQGDRVAAGQPIARVGNSGNSSEPHVHLHLQDTPTPYLGEGIPLYFYDYRTRGHLLARGMPVGGRQRPSRAFPGAFTGDIVEHAGAADRGLRGRGDAARVPRPLRRDVVLRQPSDARDWHPHGARLHERRHAEIGRRASGSRRRPPWRAARTAAARRYRNVVAYWQG
jgi:hypothetical protein